MSARPTPPKENWRARKRRSGAHRVSRARLAAASIDCLIAAHTLSADAELMTLDDDFEPMRKIVGLRLFER